MDTLRMPTDHPAAQAASLEASERATRRHEACLVSAVLLVPLAVGWVTWSAPDAFDDFNRRVTLAPFDIALGALGVSWVMTRLRAQRSASRRPGPPRPAVTLAWAFALVFAVAFAAHPSWRGLEFALRLVCGAAVVDTIRRMTPSSLHRLCVALVGSAVVQSVLAVAQSAHGRGFAFYPFDHSGPLFAFGDAHAGRGGLSHPYHLAVFLLVAVFAGLIGGRHSTGRARTWWMFAMAVIGAGMAVTFSRSMLLGLVPATLWWWGRGAQAPGRARRPLLLCLLLAFTAGVLLVPSGWLLRAQQSAASGADRGRIALAQDGLQLFADSPIVGVGPGRYVLAIAEPGGPDGEMLPSHNIVVHAATELGVFGVAVVVLIGLWFVRRCTKRGGLALGGAWVMAPFLLLDSYPYVFPTGLAVAAVWLGLVGHRSVTQPSTP